jgi:MoaA/NifB/PqqE/SkfB family radical SAM enzyme
MENHLITDKFMMDGSKMLWHLDRVVDYVNGVKIAPISIDVGISKGCNIHCEYCFGVLQGNHYKNGVDDYFPREPLLRYMKDAGECGVRSLAIIGEAEPLVNPYVYEAIHAGKKAGADMSLGTNGLLLDTGIKGQQVLEDLTWIRFNISAATQESYLRVHRSPDFDVAKSKIKFCVDTKKSKSLSLTVGLQMVLTPSNVDQVICLAQLGKDLGVDYLVVKQCSDTVENSLGVYKRFSEYKDFTEILKEAESLSTPDYKVIVKWRKIAGGRTFKQCLGTPFLLYSSGDGLLFPCGMFFDPQYHADYLMGDLKTQSFKEIIYSQRYLDVIEKVRKIDVNNCYTGCKTHAINEYLWQLKNVPEHWRFV